MNTQYVVFAPKAFNAIVTETLDKHPVETGGIFLGYITNTGVWVVVETIPPGINTINRSAYFEYDTNFVNYMANVVANQYQKQISVLGLWHRHPSSFDQFSHTDDETNRKFATGTPCGAISGLVNCDPQLRLTMYHVDKDVNYTQIDWIVDDGSIIPEEYLKLRYETADNLPSPDMIINQQTENPQMPLSENASPYTFSHAYADLIEIYKKLRRSYL